MLYLPSYRFIFIRFDLNDVIVYLTRLAMEYTGKVVVIQRTSKYILSVYHKKTMNTIRVFIQNSRIIVNNASLLSDKNNTIIRIQDTSIGTCSSSS